MKNRKMIFYFLFFLKYYISAFQRAPARFQTPTLCKVSNDWMQKSMIFAEFCGIFALVFICIDQQSCFPYVFSSLFQHRIILFTCDFLYVEVMSVSPGIVWMWGGFPGEPFVVLGNLWENASKLLLQALHNINKSNCIKNRLACEGCEFYKTTHCP